MSRSRDDLRVLAVAPVGRDAAALAEALGAHGIPTTVCHGLDDCSRRLAEGAGALLVTQEGLVDGNPDVLLAALDRQPSWSALPVIVLAAAEAAGRQELLVHLGLANGVVTLLERPVRRSSLVSAVQVALGARRRQYEVRDLLEERRRRERQLREQAAILRASEARFRQMADAAPAMLWVTNAAGRCTFLSRGWYEFTGQDQAVAPPEAWQQPVHADDLDRMRQTYREAAAGQQPFQLEYRLAGAGGGHRWVLDAARPWIGPDGQFLGYIGSIIDVHELRLAEQERQRSHALLNESEENFRTLADNIPPLAWMADASGWIFWYNRRWFAYTGTTLADVAGWGWRKVHHPDHVERVVAKIRHCFRTGEVWEDLFPLRAANGEYRWFLSRAVPLRDEAGRITRWFGTNTDVTEQRRAEETLREADRRKDEFIATLAHELRNPLAPIRTSVELLRLQGSDPDTLALCRDIIDRQARDLTRLVDDLLEVSRITRGKVELKLGPVTLTEALERALEAARPLVDAARHRLTVELPRETLWLQADPTRLTQIFTNLLNNAASYTPPGGRIDVTATVTGSAPERRVQVTITDTGIGIAEDHLPRIFEMFSQARPVLERPNAGLGIGLSLARGLVELHGGTISVASEGEGRGSTFTVTLPITAAPSRAPPAPSRGFERGGRLDILVVDDNRDAADGLGRMLELMGHAATIAYDGPEALARADRHPPDVVLLDIGLPGMNGYEVARRIRERPWGGDVLLVAQTGWGKDQDKRRSAEAGFDHHLVKPLDAAELAALLTELPEGQSS